ncbi:MAG: alcohol dehydrogenase catalytic domain-containing protein [Myxococcales bacterium]|nr:alcohol dehydrogenase catalytic domain-containing protein [Myxococcales bacterium]
MRAATFETVGATMRIESVPDPTPGPGELVLRVRGCGICGSDLHVSQLAGALPRGAVMGHEFAGEVAAVGRDVEGGFREGEAVCALPAIGCARCAPCLTGDVMGCASLRATGFGDVGGAYAEYVLVGARETLRLPPVVAASDGALVEPLAVGLHAVDEARLRSGEDVLVIGAGPVGLAVAMWARQLGAREVVVSDFVASRREMAGRMGATVLVDPAKEDPGQAFARATGHAPHTIFECVGVPGLLQQCIGLAPRGAKIVVAGVCMQPDTIVPVAASVKALCLQFVSYYRRGDFELTLAMLATGRIDPLPMVTDRIGLDALPDAFEALRTPAQQCKVIVEP